MFWLNRRRENVFIVNSFILCMDWFLNDCLNVAGESKRLNRTMIFMFIVSRPTHLYSEFRTKHTIEKLSNKNKWIVVRSLTFSLSLSHSRCFFISFCVCVYILHTIFMHLINLIRFHACIHICVLRARVRVTIRNAIALFRSVELNCCI